MSNWIEDHWKINPIKDFLNIFGFDSSTLGIEVQSSAMSRKDFLESEKEWASSGDCFIAILTSRYTLSDDVGLPSAWVHAESELSYSKNRPQLVFIEKGVQVEGLYRYLEDDQIIEFDPKNLQMLQFSVQKIIRFREECQKQMISKTIGNVGTISLFGFALYGVVSFLDSLGKGWSSNTNQTGTKILFEIELSLRWRAPIIRCDTFRIKLPNIHGFLIYWT